MRWCGLVGVVVCALVVHEPEATACSPPQPPDVDARVAPRLSRDVSPASGTTVPTNVVVRVQYAFKSFADPSTIGAIRARIIGGDELTVQVTLLREYTQSNPFQWDPIIAQVRLYEVRIPSLAPGATFELLDRFDAPCDPCVERDPAPFATFTAGAGPDSQPPVLDPGGGHIVGSGYHEVVNTCTNTTCKGSYAIWSWNPATDDGGAVWYHVTNGSSTLVAWMTLPEIQNAVSVCQDCGEFGPSLYWDKFKLEIGMTVRAVDNAGNLSAGAIVISELPACGFPPDAGPPDAPLPGPAPDAPPSPGSSSTSDSSGCSVAGSPSALPWALAVLLAAYRRRARNR